MNLNWMNQVGDWNPQLLRELKGRLKPRNLILAGGISLLGQFIIFMYFQTQLPTKLELVYNSFDRYCTGKLEYNSRECLVDGFGNLLINWQLWYLDVFTWLGIIGSISLLVAGTYLIINDLAAEERRETLNFIRLSPQTPQSILLGKMLGVPILLYLGVILALPLHICLGLAGQISFPEIFSFYAVVVAAGILYYSSALLFALVGSWLGGFQAWLGGGVALGFLLVTTPMAVTAIPNEYPLVFARLINPTSLIPTTAISAVFRYSDTRLNNFHWFALPLGENLITTLGFALLIYGLGTYFIWHSLQRCFRDPNTTMLSKRQSYLLTASFALLTLGCANWQKLVLEGSTSKYLLAENLMCLLFLDFWLFLYLIAALNPHRQPLQDWARYRRTSNSQGVVGRKLVQDLIWGEKSPGLLAIAINAMIAIIAICGLIILSHVQLDEKIRAIFALVLSSSLAMLYASIAQLFLLTKNQHRIFWAAATVAALIVVPVIVLAIFSPYVRDNNYFYLLSVIGPIFAIAPGTNSISPITALLSILGYWSAVGLLIFQLKRKLVKAGESATKALMASN
ncbi:hypothetical protein NIES37_30890 [Tolypothrix tenuis PCC 7101]|uniref:Uncharacterized protein n=1 Tax=Tolypothrix tenuis PCC 7101 TaxID=231146 RepID=A0A1Z4N087_9CYAN|nr:hypothetical protein [Aulosira sp. FACHB-113]BAY99110.1 hypothetical protein NIES37_30890 [Tolypothrix tenuis PCC 7101]BAZ76967.1 hypothetical protein NIES50_55690 [Aulosira laxa NIES-50]